MNRKNAMLKKRELRACARKALETRGFLVVEKTEGGLPGSRLQVFKNAKSSKVAVRTSYDREISFSRRPDGRWMTLNKVDEVIVALPSIDQIGAVEVMCFAPEVLIAALENVIAAKKGAADQAASKTPVFLALDLPFKPTTSGTASNLGEKSKWREIVSPVSIPQRSIEQDSVAEFLERVKREYAELVGLDVTKVSVEFRIQG